MVKALKKIVYLWTADTSASRGATFSSGELTINPVTSRAWYAGGPPAATRVCGTYTLLGAMSENKNVEMTSVENLNTDYSSNLKVIRDNCEFFKLDYRSFVSKARTCRSSYQMLDKQSQSVRPVASFLHLVPLLS